MVLVKRLTGHWSLIYVNVGPKSKFSIQQCVNRVYGLTFTLCAVVYQSEVVCAVHVSIVDYTCTTLSIIY